MATGMRERTTNVGGIIKRIWYAMTGTTQGLELASLDDTGKLKCVSEQISGLAGTGNRMVVVDSTGNLIAANFSLRTFATVIAGTPFIFGEANAYRANFIYEITIAGRTPALAGEYKKILLHSDSDGNAYYRTIISGGSGITIGVGGAGQFTISVGITGDYIVQINNI